jgi:hypothetical protein
MLILCDFCILVRCWILEFDYRVRWRGGGCWWKGQPWWYAATEGTITTPVPHSSPKEYNLWPRQCVQQTNAKDTSVSLKATIETHCMCVCLDNEQTNKLTPWPESASELHRPSDCRMSANLVPSFADRGCHVVSVTDPYGRILVSYSESSSFIFSCT